MSYTIREYWECKMINSISIDIDPSDYLHCDTEDEVWDAIYEDLYACGDWDEGFPIETYEPTDAIELPREFFEEWRELKRINKELDEEIEEDYE